jgi:ATP-dependent helicase/nuclease subunit B
MRPDFRTDPARLRGLVCLRVMPETIYLTEHLPLVFKAANWLAALSSDRPLDLSRCAVLVPTSGAGRRLRQELVRASSAGGTGVLVPLVTTPMGLLAVSCHGKIATRTDALLAWAQIISAVSPADYPVILAGFSDHRTSALQIGKSLMDLCWLLAEAGLTPASPEIVCACPHQEGRWSELESLYRQYLECLEKAGFSDANAASISAARAGFAPPDVARVIVAGVPDLSRISQEYLENLEAAGIPVSVLVDAPDCDDARFDPWGRPDIEAWRRRELSLGAGDVFVAAEPSSEAEIVARLLGPNGAAGLCLADAQNLAFQERALRKHGLKPYDPAGKSLAYYECATLSRFWLSFCRSDRLADLRSLAEHPIFLRMLCRESGLGPSAALATLDEVQTEILVETLADAGAYFSERKSAGQQKPRAAALIEGSQRLRKKLGAFGSLRKLREFLGAVYTGCEVVAGSGEGEAFAALSGLLRAVLESSLSTPDLGEAVFCEEMKSIAVFEHRSAAQVDLNGWLEAPWLPHPALILSGCVEGALPARVSAHPFLPDSLRIALGLQSSAQRFTRDAYLLHCVLGSREPGAVKLTLCRAGADGEPSKPSRLLFQCPDADLGTRVRSLFGPGISLRTTHPRERAWLLKIPKRPTLASLRVTAIGDYLKCPLRFYFKHVLHMREFDAQKTEMNALDFGIVLHKTVENFANEVVIRRSRDSGAIEKFILAELDAVLSERFGARLSLPVRVQRESLRARLRQFARIQAAECHAGWQIQGGEFRFEKDRTLSLAGLPVVASLDRVDIHERTGARRILDYKTFARRKAPADIHFEPASSEHDAFEVVFEGKAMRWRDLQLPLYRALAQFHWPDDPQPPSVGYFLLPERIEESGIEEFALDPSVFASAMSSADVVADRVRRGVYWPPRAVLYEDYEDIFLGEDPASTLSEDSRDFLAGARNFTPAP